MGLKLPYLGIFGLEFGKDIAIYLPIFWKAKFNAKMKILKPRTKNALVVLDTTIERILGIFEQKFENYIVTTEMNAPEFVLLESLVQK